MSKVSGCERLLLDPSLTVRIIKTRIGDQVFVDRLLLVNTYRGVCECGTEIRYRTLKPAKVGDELPARCWTCDKRVVMTFFVSVMKLERAARQSDGMITHTPPVEPIREAIEAYQRRFARRSTVVDVSMR